MATELTLTGILVLLVFIVVLAVLVTDKFDKTALTLIGATAVAVILYIFPQYSDIDGELITTNKLLKLVPWDTVLFIFFMMLTVAMSSRSGLFQWLAILTIQVTKGNNKTLYFSFILLTFVISFFFDIVTTMLIIAPVTIEIMKVLNRDFRPFLMAEAIVANFGSIPSLIGAVPNIVIGNAKYNTTLDPSINFLEFLFILGPLGIILLITSIPVFLQFHKKVLDQQQDVTDLDIRIFLLDINLLIKQRRVFIVSFIGLLILVVGFTIGQFFQMTPVLIAMIAMSFLLIASRDAITETLKEVQWGTIFFIVGLFIMVQAIEEIGLIGLTAIILEPYVEEIPEFGGVLMIIISGGISSVVDNIPISAALAPLAVTMGNEIPLIDGKFIGLALVVGITIGGYLTPIGNSAGILALSFAEKERSSISFSEFAKLGLTLAIIHLVISCVYFIVFAPYIHFLLEIL